MKTIFDEYKEKICTNCKHYGDNSFNDCSICKCVDGKVRCEHYSEKEN